jgi:SAM-dependent methyltransferase
MADPETVQYYDHNAAKYADVTSRRSMKRAIERFSGLLSSGAGILDVGCGGGRDLKVFQSLRFNAIGLDVSAELAGMAARFSGRPVVVADMTAMPFAPATFDAVWASASLLHLDHDGLLAALAEIRLVLKSGGLFFSSVKQGVGQKREQDGRYFNYFRPNEWRSVQDRCGLSVIDESADEDRHGERNDRWIRSIARRV